MSRTGIPTKFAEILSRSPVRPGTIRSSFAMPHIEVMTMFDHMDWALAVELVAARAALYHISALYHQLRSEERPTFGHLRQTCFIQAGAQPV